MTGPVQPDGPARSFNPGPRYRRTRYGWEPADAWDGGTRPIPVPAEWLMAAQVHRLVMDTAATGCSLKSAVKWWDYILRKAP